MAILNCVDEPQISKLEKFSNRINLRKEMFNECFQNGYSYLVYSYIFSDQFLPKSYTEPSLRMFSKSLTYERVTLFHPQSQLLLLTN